MKKYQCDGQMDLLSYMTTIFQPVTIGIGIGSENAIKRAELPKLLKVPNDRQARDRLNQMKKAGYVIVNAGRGKGYFIPKKTDYNIALRYYKSEMSKIEDSLKALEPLKKWLQMNGECI